jgi:hypothetical protein
MTFMCDKKLLFCFREVVARLLSQHAKQHFTIIDNFNIEGENNKTKKRGESEGEGVSSGGTTGELGGVQLTLNILSSPRRFELVKW